MWSRSLHGDRDTAWGGFYRTRTDASRPDAQLMMCPFTLDFGEPDDRARWRDTFAQWPAGASD